MVSAPPATQLRVSYRDGADVALAVENVDLGPHGDEGDADILARPFAPPIEQHFGERPGHLRVLVPEEAGMHLPFPGTGLNVKQRGVVDVGVLPENVGCSGVCWCAR